MEYNVEELKKALIEKCKEESIIYALVAINRYTKDIILPNSLQDALNNPNYYVCTCRKVEEKYQIEEEK